MIKIIPRHPSLGYLSLDDFIAYLKTAGWKPIKYLDDRMLVFARAVDDTGEQPSLIALPANEQLSDFTGRIAEAVRRLADVEQISSEDVVQKIQSVGQDIIYHKCGGGGPLASSDGDECRRSFQHSLLTSYTTSAIM
ncbi:MAG TPA: hypothetical protein VHZ51_22575 [Ktedonobacteraceae bacterium]|nr:hypothetical protein [Ktedonobacteraceae bacterium]